MTVDTDASIHAEPHVPESRVPGSRVPGSRVPAWVAPVAVGGVVAAGALALAMTETHQLAAFGPGCPFKMLTGLDCPGCGGTRAAQALLAGQPLRALDHNPLTVALMPVLGWGWVRWLGARLGRGTPPTLPAAMSMSLAIALGVFWVLRNVPALSWLGSGVSWSG